MHKRELLKFMREMIKTIKENNSREGSLEYRLTNESDYYVIGSYRVDDISNDYVSIGFNSKKGGLNVK